MGTAYQIGAYYFPNWHTDPINAHHAQPGRPVGEWPAVQAARPRYPGHRQPLVPVWGYEDEADPRVMEKKINAAADHGLDYWIFDWYWTDQGHFLRRCLEEGYLGAPNHARVPFCLMWANHDMGSMSGAVKQETWQEMTSWITEHLFPNPAHFRVEGKPYFSFFDIPRLMDTFGSVQATRAALDEWRTRAQAIGLPGIHFNAILRRSYQVPGESEPSGPLPVLEKLGFDSITSYHWLQHIDMPDFPETEYAYVRDRYLELWEETSRATTLPFFPNVTMGWDSWPRTDPKVEFHHGEYPYMPVMRNNTPTAFRKALELTKHHLEARGGPRILSLFAWNEWTEGGYLEPEVLYKYGYLEAIRDVFGGA